MSLQLCGAEATDFTKVGINWEIDVSIATCVLQEISTYDVVITVTDESSVTTTLEIYVADPNAVDDSNDDSTSDSDSGDDSSALPSVSLLATLSVTLLGAAFARRKQDL
jgi:hypothetical protein